MKPILFARSVRPLRNGGVNAKSYPFWDELKELLQKEGYEVEELTELPLDQLEAKLKSALTVICVDSFVQHFCWSIGVKAVVIWGKSDPEIFGHLEHINLLKDKRNLRPDPFRWWEDVPFDESVFVEPKIVLDAIKRIED